MIYRDMNKYHNGKIYEIVDVGYNKCYIGSTTESLSMRMVRHRSQYKDYKNGKRANIRSFDLFEEYGIENCKMELLEYCNCETKEELLKREGEHIRNNDCVNRCVAGRNFQQWKADNPGAFKKYNIKYNEKNKHKLHEEHRCPCGGKYLARNKARHHKSMKHLSFIETKELDS